MTKILLTGVNGQVGHALRHRLEALGEVVAVDRTQLSLTDIDSMRVILNQIKPDVIVNPAAYTAVDKAESEMDLAYAVNAIAPEILAQWCEANNALLIHYSTDYVFSGQHTVPYIETDPRKPKSVYGYSKLAGEQAIISSGCAHVILRTSWVYSEHGSNFIKTILRLASERDSLSIVSDQIGTPTSAHLIAESTCLILEQILEKHIMPFGVYHLTAEGTTTWYEFAKYIVSQAQNLGVNLKVNAGEIKAIATIDYPTPAKRPAYSVLNCDLIDQQFNLIRPNWKVGVDNVLKDLIH